MPRVIDRSRRATVTTFDLAIQVSKEEHDRERNRWMGRVEEIEKKLIESETVNSGMVINKAELKKKIVEMEKSQKPILDQNRKLGDRNKMLQQEVKKMEQRICHSQDDFLTLKDTYEKIVKENACLKEKRVSPEKLEELTRYRNKVLEYSKCITALRSSAFEKDKRYEMLVQKFKRLQKCLKKSENDDDRMSNGGSDCSATSTGSLDTITEDFEEAFAKDIETNYQALYRENAELQRALNELQLNTSDLSEENFLRDQISFAQSTIEQQQLVIDSTQEMMSQNAQLKSTIMSQQDFISSLEQCMDELKQQLVSQTERNDLLEFQVLEMEEDCKQQAINAKSAANLQQEKTQIQKELDTLKTEHETAINAHKSQIEELQNKLQNVVPAGGSTLEDKKEMEALTEKYQKSESANESLNEEIRTLSKELGKLRFQTQGKDSDLNRERKMTEALSAQLQVIVTSSQEETLKKEEEIKSLKEKIASQDEKYAELEKSNEELQKKLADITAEYAAFKDEQRPEIKTELERRYEESRYRLSRALEKIHAYEAKLAEGNTHENDSSGYLEQLAEVKEFNAHLERQFNSQSDLIEALKRKLLEHRSFCEKINKLAEIEDPSRIQEELIMFSRENNCEDAKLASNIALIIKDIRKNSLYSPLEISTAHHKIRPYSSVESSTEWQSNSSEGIVSPDEQEE